jgi:acetyl-CoA synthetase
MGRVDDVLNVSGHRLGTAEVESALVAHEAVAESAVVGFPHDIKGQGIYAFVTLKAGHAPSEKLMKELIAHVRKEIGPIASPDKVHFADALPKTRSGKIMRRILRKIAEGQIDELGDISTLDDSGVVNKLVANRQ